eukprot:TRINITY_DN14173_c0_g1_i1.p1 TRINITY_DN14173_c0_g1~~TRINITY_DN14173_c0_g1_i1.p1  ORF type:complete len:992 (-),score=278.02 TRINITY_DN14173_c0_g1_i1:33-2642(-)
MGYYPTLTPHVILRNVIENPGWYTPYTPYQGEIAQGRLAALLTYQTMIQDLTKLPLANASLLDEATAAAEAMSVAFANGKKKKHTFFVSSNCHPQVIEVVRTRAVPFGIKLVIGDETSFNLADVKDDLFGVLLQYPFTDGRIIDPTAFVAAAKALGATAICATDLMALTVLKAPGEIGFDIAVGNSQRFGVPVGYGGPHAGFFAVSDELKRITPGRIIGTSVDDAGKPAIRMALQTREQHIRREKATSNICTAQALLANTAGFYATYHGPTGVKNIATAIHLKASILAAGLTQVGYAVSADPFFDTVKIITGDETDKVVAHVLAAGFNVRNLNSNAITVALDEPTTQEEIDALLKAFASYKGKQAPALETLSANAAPVDFGSLARTSEYMTNPVFNTYTSETEMMRYLFYLQKKDLGLNSAMIPLGSCTMKLNAATEMIPITWPELNSLHPFVPAYQAEGYRVMIQQLERDLAKLTGFAGASLQPNAGSQGEYTGLMVIQAYHRHNGQHQRNVCLIPTSAHGTNPASAAMVGLKIVSIAVDSEGNVDMDDLRKKAVQYKDTLSSIMITYPSTHGIYEESIKEVCDIIHENGGQVYMDGANMNAQVGLTSPGHIGADVCHLNLHKTFCIPHGGGGPGVGPTCVAAHLVDFLPSHPVVTSNPSDLAMGAVSAAPWGSASILPITWTYIKMMGGEGLKKASQVAMLNANYMAKRLESSYKILYRSKAGFCAHEFILDIRPFKEFGIDEVDVAKRLIDYGFHGPTMSWPVPGTLMIEPTESEPLSELNRLIEAFECIREEIREVEEKKISAEDSVLRHAPHTMEVVIADKWDRKYSREKAAYPVPALRHNKHWPTVGRIDNVHGDRNLCTACQ